MDTPASRACGIHAARLNLADYAVNFGDAHPPLTRAQALIEAERCYYCHDAPCATACPTGIDIPSFIHRIAQDNNRGAARAILEANPLGGMCARVCPTEVLCEQACVRNANEDKPVEIGSLQRYATDALMASGRQLYRQGAATGRKVAVVGWSRGGTLGKIATVRRPDLVSALITLGTPNTDPLAVNATLALQLQLDQITARLEFDAQGRPVIAAEALSDPRWLKPYSGLYWQVDAMAPDGRERAGVLRSRSLWDTSLALQVDALADGTVHVHEMTGPQGAPLLVLERTVRAEGVRAARWRLMVAADLQATQAATARFTVVLALSLAVLLLLLAAAAWAQVALGLKPLQALQRAVQDVQEARASQLQGSFPAEVQPLVDDFNAVLRRHGEVVERARTQAGNLAPARQMIRSAH